MRAGPANACVNRYPAKMNHPAAAITGAKPICAERLRQRDANFTITGRGTDARPRSRRWRGSEP